MQEALLRHDPRIVHFSGRGRPGGLVLQNDRGEARQVPKSALSDLFRILRGNVGIVVLNACYTRDQARALRDVVEYTISINDRISDAAAMVFAAHFYQSLVYGRTVRDAFDLAVNQLQLEGIHGAEAPELMVRSGVDQSAPFLDQQVVLSQPAPYPLHLETPQPGQGFRSRGLKRARKLRVTVLITLAVLVISVSLAALGKRLNSDSHTSEQANVEQRAPVHDKPVTIPSDGQPKLVSPPGGERKDQEVSPPQRIDKTFEVRSRLETDLMVRQGDSVTISANGQIRLGLLAGIGGPDGVPGFQSYSHIVEFPHGSLLARIGGAGDGGWRLIGSKASFQASRPGLLELLVNDADAGNNQGQFSVTVSITQAKRNP